MNLYLEGPIENICSNILVFEIRELDPTAQSPARGTDWYPQPPSLSAESTSCSQPHVTSSQQILFQQLASQMLRAALGTEGMPTPHNPPRLI